MNVDVPTILVFFVFKIVCIDIIINVSSINIYASLKVMVFNAMLYYTHLISDVHSKISKFCICELDVSPQKSHSNTQWYVQILREKIKIKINKKMIPKSVNLLSVKNIRNSLKQDFHKYTAFAYPPLYHQFFDIHRVIHFKRFKCQHISLNILP